MPSFSKASRHRLYTCDTRLINLFEIVVKNVDCTIVCGHRNEAAQTEAYENGFSKLEWPNSKHNIEPSLAVDVVPYPIDWNNIQRFAMFAGYVLGIAQCEGVYLRAGIDWNGNFDPTDNWQDAPHFMIIDPPENHLKLVDSDKLESDLPPDVA